MTAKLRRREPLTAGEFERAKRMTRKLSKATLPTPSISHFFPGDRALGRDVYRKADELLDDASYRPTRGAFSISLHVAAHTHS